MKVYYREDDLYPATYNFKDEADGTSGNDIDFVDSSTTDTNTTLQIISSLDGHRKVLEMYDNDAGAIVRVNHDISDITYGTYEFWMQTSDATLENIHAIKHGGAWVYAFRIDADQFQYWDGGWANVGLVPSDDTWYHIRIDFECTAGGYQGLAQYDWHVYINGVYYGDYDFNSNEAHIDILTIYTNAGDSGYYSYYDAWGVSWDTDYTVGDNRTVKFHDPYNKEEITSIIEYPKITAILDKYYMGNITIRDYEGALYSDWYDRDFTPILIEDDSDNVLFRGFLTKKVFTTNSLILTIAGIGILLDWQPFGSDGYINYVLAEGKVNAPISSDSIIQLQTDALAVFTWDVGWWIDGAKDLGLLIVDKTDVNTRTWDSSATSQEGGTVNAGNNASTMAHNDTDHYSVRDTTSGLSDLVITHTIDGVVIDSTTSYLKSIEIQWNFRVGMHGGDGPYSSWATAFYQIKKDTQWITFAQVPIKRDSGFTYWTPWQRGIPLTETGGNGNEFIIEDTDTELAKFFNKTGNDYDELKGLRCIVLNSRMDDAAWVEVNIDFINVKVGYMSDDISPVMETITENTATAITCTDVSAWDETGVVDEDGFKIGANTRTVIQDIANHSGLDIDRIDNFGNTSTAPNTYATGDGGTVDWDTTGGDHFGELDDANDATYVSTDANSETEMYTFNEVNILGGYCTQIVVKAKCSRTAHEGQTLYFCYSVDGGTSWSSPQDTSTDIGVGFTWQTLTFSTLTEYDLSDFQIKMYNSVFIAGGTVYCSELYVIFTISGSSFSKYMAREFKGSYCMEPLKAVCELEGAHWYEDYINNRIVILKLADFVDSTVDLTEADYGHDWEYEDACNQVRSFYVFGKAEDGIFAKAVDESVDGYISRQLIDESIATIGDAQEVADAQLALLNSKRPSVKLSLNADNALLQLGTTVHVTQARPTIAQVLYPIRKIERSRRGFDDIKLVIYCGLGESTTEEEIAKIIRDNAFRSHKALTDRLIS